MRLYRDCPNPDCDQLFQAVGQRCYQCNQMVMPTVAQRKKLEAAGHRDLPKTTQERIVDAAGPCECCGRRPTNEELSFDLKVSNSAVHRALKAAGIPSASRIHGERMRQAREKEHG